MIHSHPRSRESAGSLNAGGLAQTGPAPGVPSGVSPQFPPDGAPSLLPPHPEEPRRSQGEGGRPEGRIFALNGNGVLWAAHAGGAFEIGLDLKGLNALAAIAAEAAQGEGPAARVAACLHTHLTLIAPDAEAS